ncbi:MAG TPA: hypothetical protein ENI18_01445 [Candidatus Aminicenantes bacterium]|nr:hypothetical protein [Candidatus Aminicenantes bacterium]
MIRFLRTGLLVFLFSIGISPLIAEDFDIHGFVQTNFSLRIAATGEARTFSGKPLPDYLLGDERVQLEITRFGATTQLFGKIDLFYDAVDKLADLDVREAYIDLTLGKFDIRAGRQIITWGVGDLVFINDVFPKNWVAFLSGQPLQYLKFGSDAININIFPKFVSVQIIAIPFYRADVLPRGERLLAFDPLPTIANREEVQPEMSFKNTQIAGRLYRYLGNFDFSLYFYKGFWGSPPGMILDSADNLLTFSHPRLNVYGGSLQGAFLKGVLSVEGGYYDSRDDQQGTNMGIENSQIRFLAGYQRALGENLILGLQYYGERIQDYTEYVQNLPSTFPQRKEWRHTLSLRLTQLLKYQTLRFSLFIFYSPNEKDYYVNPEVRYDLGSGVWFAAGGIFLGGEKDYTFFGQFEKNDNVYFILRYEF